MTTAGAPATIALSLDTDSTILADGKDAALVAVSILDSNVRTHIIVIQHLLTLDRVC